MTEFRTPVTTEIIELVRYAIEEDVGSGDIPAQLLHADAQAKADLAAEMEKLNRQKAAMGAKIRELQAAGGEAYADLKKGLDRAMAEMDKAYARAMKRFDK